MKKIALLCLIIYGYTSSAFAYETQPAPHYVQAIYDNLIDAIGDKRPNIELPKLIIMDRVKSVAAYRSADNKIIIEQLALELCESIEDKDMRNSALAFIIGHELGHFYHKHEAGHELESGFGTTCMHERYAEQRKTEEEKEADLHGAFAAYLAGYDVIEAIPVVLDKVYDGYKLQDNLTHYPEKAVRERTANEVETHLTQLVETYEMGHYFMVIGRYAEAYGCYYHVLKYVKTKEVYANIGLSRLTYAMEQMDDPNQYYYPIELDFDLSINRGNDWGRNQSFLFGTALESLKKAADYFELCVEHYDSDYAGAYINLACTHDLRGDYSLAIYYLNKAESCSLKDAQKDRIQLLRGIIAAHQENKRSAEHFFNTISSSNPLYSLAQKNISILQSRYRTSTPVCRGYTNEQLDGCSFAYPPQTFDYTIFPDKEVASIAHINVKYMPHSTFASFNTGVEQNLMQKTTDKSLKTKKGVGVGNTDDDLKKAYGTARIVAYDNGYFWVYCDANLIFRLNDKDVIEEWAIFESFEL